MSTTIANLLKQADTTGRVIYTTSSASPSANQLLLLSVVSSMAGADSSYKAKDPMVSGLGLVWTLIGGGVFQTNNNRRASVYAASVGADPPSSDPITIDYTSSFANLDPDVDPTTMESAIWILDSAAGRALLLPQSLMDGISSTATPSLSYPTTFKTDSVAYAVIANNRTGNITPRSGWTELAERHYSARTSGLETQWKNGSDTAVSASAGSSSGWRLFAIEVALSHVHFKLHAADDPANHEIYDVTILNVSTSAHGFVPKAPGDPAMVLRGDGTWGYPGIPASITPSAVTAAATVPAPAQVGQS